MISFVDFGKLESQGLATYKWGRSRITLSRFSSYRDRKYLVRVLAGLTQGVGVWENQAEFRAFVALAHEMVHYFQDISTGVGHWDYIQRSAFIPRILTDFLVSTWLSGEAMELKKSTEEMLQEFSSISLYNVYDLRSERALTSIRALIGQYENYQAGEEEDYTVPRLLELDAVLGVWSLISGLKTSSLGAEIAAQNSQLYWPFRMREEYSETFKQMLSAFLTMQGIGTADVDENHEEMSRAISVFKAMMPVLIDLSLAYPPPSYFDDKPDDRRHFEPGIRLIRLMHSLQREVQLSISQSSDLVVLIDEGTRRTPEYCYPPVTEIYNLWVEFFEGRGVDDPVGDWRREISQERSSSPSNFAYRRIYDFALRDVPLFIEMPELQSDVIYQTARLIGEQGPDLYWTIKAIDRDMSLAELFLSRGGVPYVCPLASGGRCEVAVEACRKGIPRLAALPQSAGCSLRSGLESSGFNL